MKITDIIQIANKKFKEMAGRTTEATKRNFRKMMTYRKTSKARDDDTTIVRRKEHWSNPKYPSHSD